MPPTLFLLKMCCVHVCQRVVSPAVFRLLGLLGVWHAELSELLCDFAAWFPATPLLSSCRV